MPCWCGHERWHHFHGPSHHYGRHFAPPGYYPLPGAYPPDDYYYRPSPSRMRQRPDTEELAEYLEYLEEELARVRQELNPTGPTTSGE